MGWVRSNKKGSGSGARYGLYPLKEIDLIPEAQVDDTNIIYSGYDFGGYPYRAFDKTGSGWVSNQTTTPRARYIGFKFTEPVLCNGLKLDYNNPGSYFSSQRPAVYTIQGSNDDGTTWTDIYTDGWNPSDTGSMVSRKITFENFDEYKWYRIAIDASGGDGYCIINEITFYKVVYGQIEIQSASGSLVNFTTSLALPLVALKTNIVAQGGGGTPSSPIPIVGKNAVNVVSCGGNLYDDSTYLTPKKYIDISHLKVGSTYTILAKNTADIKLFKIAVSSGSTSVWQSLTVSGASFTVTQEMVDTCKMWVIDQSWAIASEQEVQGAKICLNYGSDSTYHEYTTPDTFTLPLGQTVYGGYVDWKLGKGYITYKKIVLDGVNEKFTSAWGMKTNGYASYKQVPDGVSADCFCDKMTYTNLDYNSAPLYSVGGGNGATNTITFILPNTVTTGEEAKAWLIDNNLTLCYKLATPIEISLPTTMPQTIEGVQNWFADSGDIEVSFKQGILDYND